ncbi:MAG: VCBS repeat-containing protein, partial [Deltaproteobacteria bacterium]|nr:VCBS repeat-containing protein [Deltaproteobacteria bacterium]
DLPGQKETLLKSISDPPAAYITALNDTIPSLTNNLENEFRDYILVSVPEVTLIETNVWRVTSDYTDFILRLDTKTKISEDGLGTQTSVSELNFYRAEKSRGLLIDAFIGLRDLLAKTSRDLLLSPYNGPPAGGEPLELLADLVDDIIEAGNRLLRGEDLDGVFDMDQLKDDLLEDLTELGEKISDRVKELFGKISSGEEVTGADLKELAEVFTAAPAEYLHYWIHNIDVGLSHWADLGLALSRALFDPQSKRDVQNEGGASYGADVADPDFLYLDRRADFENDVGILSVIFDELDDPNNDQKTDDSFINQYLLPMFGMPHKLGELRTELQGFLTELESQVIEPTRELLGDVNPLDPIMDFFKEYFKKMAKEVLRNIVMDLFGFDIELFEYLDSLSSGKLDIKSIEILYPTDIQGLIAGATTRVDWDGHTMEKGDRVVIMGIDEASPWSDLNVNINDSEQNGHLITEVHDDYFLIDVNSNGYGTYDATSDPGQIGRFAKFDMFKSTDREKLDEYLGFGDSDHHYPFPFVDEVTGIPDYVQVKQYGVENPTGDKEESAKYIRTIYHEGARGGLLENVEFDKEKFAAYANTVTTAKMLLLQEEDPLSLSGIQPKTISKLLSDLLPAGQYYDFEAAATLNGDHGGNILTATLSGVTDAFDQLVGVTETPFYQQPIYSDLWLTTIDGDHAWRQDSATTLTEFYRSHTGTADDPLVENTVEWKFTATEAGNYRVYTDWRATIYQFASKAAPYEIWVNCAQIGGPGPIYVDQTTAPDDVDFEREINGKNWLESWERLEPLGAGVPITLVVGQTLSVILKDDVDEELDVIAGRVYIEKVVAPPVIPIITDADPGYITNEDAIRYKESLHMLFDSSEAGSTAGWITALNGVPDTIPGMVPQEMLDLFAKNGISDSYFSVHDFKDSSIPLVLANIPMVNRLVLGQFSLPEGTTEVAQEAIDAFKDLITDFSEDFLKIFGIDPLDLSDPTIDNLIKNLILLLDFDPVSKYIWTQLPESVRTTFMTPTNDPEPLLELLAENLSHLIQTDTGLYSGSRFAGVILSAETKTLLDLHLPGSALTGERLLRLNRLLLEDVYRTEIAKSLPTSFVVEQKTAGSKWFVRRVDKVHASKSDKFEYKEGYSVFLDSGLFKVYTDWQDIDYAMGTGNFPLWESNALRYPVFRELFIDWENFGVAFPDLDDAPTTDTHVTTTSFTFGTFSPYVAPTPSLIAPTVTNLIEIDILGNVEGVVTDFWPSFDTEAESYGGNLVLHNITGNSAGGQDTLTLYVDGDVLIDGFIGGGGLTDIEINATGTITLQGRAVGELGNVIVENGAVISSRQVAAGANHWDATSTGKSGNIILEGSNIIVGADASILAHADAGNAAGNVELTAYDEALKTWEFLGIDGFNWRQSEATVDIGMGARLTGQDVKIEAETLTQKTLDGLNPSSGSHDPAFAYATRDVVVADVNQDGWDDLFIGNYEQPDLLYLNNGEGKLLKGREISSDNYKTTALAVGNVDSDAELELIVGTDDDDIFLFNFSNFIKGPPVTGILTGEFTVVKSAVEDGDTKTTALALGDVDVDGDLDLVVGIAEGQDRLYLNNGSGSFTQNDFGGTTDTTSLALANLDTDSQLELVVGTAASGVLVYDYSTGNYD